MRSRSTSPSSSEASPDASVASSDFSELSHPSGVDQLTTVLEQVDLSSTSSDDEGYEIVVLPMSSASVHSEQSQFYMLSTSTASEAESESDSESNRSSSASSGSEPTRSALPSKDATVATSSAASLHLPEGGSSRCKTLMSTPGEELSVPTTSEVASDFATSTLSKGQRKRCKRAARKAAAQAEPPVSKSTSAPTAKLTKAQRKQEARALLDAAKAVSGSSTSTSSGSKIPKSKKAQRNQAVIEKAAHAVISGKMSAAQFSRLFDELQTQKSRPLTSVSAAASSSHTSSTSNASTSATLSKGQRQRRRRAAIKAAATAVISGILTKEEASANFTKQQRKKLNGIIREATDAGCASSSAGSQTDASASAGLSKNQRKKRNRAAIKEAASAVIAGTTSISAASAKFNPAQQANLQRLVLDHTKRGLPVSETPSTRAPSLAKSKRRTASGYDSISDSDDSDDSEDDSDDCSSDYAESGYSTERSLSASAAASAINSDTESFTSQQENKLLLWQALCIEFGLVEADELTDLPTRHDLRAQRSSAPSPPSVSGSESTSRSVTPTQGNPFPTSLTQAKALLSTAHVPLRKYMKLRQKDPSPEAGGYAYLLEPSFSALRKVLRDERAYVRLSEVKEAFLNPLLKDFGFHRSRKG